MAETTPLQALDELVPAHLRATRHGEGFMGQRYDIIRSALAALPAAAPTDEQIEVAVNTLIFATQADDGSLPAARKFLMGRIAALASPAPAAAPSEGVKQVPVEPTHEMLLAGAEVRMNHGSARGVWSAMLAASPSMGSAVQQSDLVHPAAGQATRTAVQAAPNVPQDGGEG